MGSKKKKDVAIDAATTTETPTETAIATESSPEAVVATEPAPPSEPKPKGKKKSKGVALPSGPATLAEIAAGYLAHMADEGKSDGTISSYRMELKTAAAELGEDTKVANLTPERVQQYFESKRVTKLRSGRAKAKPSIDKTRRVLRLALVWAEECGIVAMAPLPEAPVKAKA